LGSETLGLVGGDQVVPDADEEDVRQCVHDQGNEEGVPVDDQHLGEQEQDQVGRQQQEAGADEPQGDAQEEAEEGVHLGVGITVDLQDQQVADRAETQEDRQGQEHEEAHREHQAARKSFLVPLCTNSPEHVERDHSLT